MSDEVYRNARAVYSNKLPPSIDWCGDSLKWSPNNGGCLMWTRNGRNWSSQNEGEFPTAHSAERALFWYLDRGVTVDLDSLEDCSVVQQ